MMNVGHRLGKWFIGKFGSTQCQAIAHCKFFKTAGVIRFIYSDGVTKCDAITQDVAHEVKDIVRLARSGQP